MSETNQRRDEQGPRHDPDRDPRDESTQIANEERRRRAPLFSGIVAAIGAWVGLSVFLYDASAAVFWNNVLVGAAIFLAATYNYYRLSSDVPLSVGVAALVALLGIWLVVVGPLLEMAGGIFWSTLASGILVTGLSGINAYEAREARTIATADESAPR
ncbi:SPW repeat domain-containing protein [Natrononativus amylolyticus]|uniref:SPW repeat domain-containing protein n=1 Tax=Natrononativus amylolyticus TaxID=2963434 RepID=UPI0020CE1468|nr:hypothetical protein [Natrononativus amylolyticus]